jgi:hypothetical protein
MRIALREEPHVSRFKVVYINLAVLINGSDSNIALEDIVPFAFRVSVQLAHHSGIQPHADSGHALRGRQFPRREHTPCRDRMMRP